MTVTPPETTRPADAVPRARSRSGSTGDAPAGTGHPAAPGAAALRRRRPDRGHHPHPDVPPARALPGQPAARPGDAPGVQPRPRRSGLAGGVGRLPLRRRRLLRPGRRPLQAVVLGGAPLRHRARHEPRRHPLGAPPAGRGAGDERRPRLRAGTPPGQLLPLARPRGPPGRTSASRPSSTPAPAPGGTGGGCSPRRTASTGGGGPASPPPSGTTPACSTTPCGAPGP